MIKLFKYCLFFLVLQCVSIGLSVCRSVCLYILVHHLRSITSQSTVVARGIDPVHHPVARKSESWQCWLIALPSAIIHDKFQPPIPTRWRDMSCRLHQRIPCEEWGEGRTFIHFQKLHILTFLRAKFQVKRTIFKFGGFFGTPLDDWGGWDPQNTHRWKSKMAAMVSQDLKVEENIKKT